MTNTDKPVSDDEFRAALGLFPAGVTVVARSLPDGTPYGMTVSSFTSVSLHPHLVLVCIDRAARFLVDLPSDFAFAINVLSDHQQAIAARFASRLEDDRFAAAPWHPGWSGVPTLKGVVATFGCVARQVLDGGDHLILLAEVLHIESHRGNPLVWCDRAYHALHPPGNNIFPR